MLLSLCFLCSLMSCKNAYPLNFVGLAVFTMAISFSLSRAPSPLCIFSPYFFL